MSDIPPWRFMPLTQVNYKSLEHAAYLKGLLRPFKGKGEMESWALLCMSLRDGLIDLARKQLLPQTRGHPYNLLPAQLSLQVTGAGTTYLRWRNPERSRMGVSLWEKLMASPTVPAELVGELHAMEEQRIVFNMQMSLLHSIARQAIDGAARQAHAENVLRQRMPEKYG